MSRNKLEQLNDDGIYNANNNANVILYVGLGMIAIGLIITFAQVWWGAEYSLLYFAFSFVPFHPVSTHVLGNAAAWLLIKRNWRRKKLLDKRLITSAGVESIPRSSLQESAKSRSTPLPPIITAHPLLFDHLINPPAKKMIQERKRLLLRLKNLAKALQPVEKQQQRPLEPFNSAPLKDAKQPPPTRISYFKKRYHPKSKGRKILRREEEAALRVHLLKICRMNWFLVQMDFRVYVSYISKYIYVSCFGLTTMMPNN
ncbi:unnamed protein product [Lepeophtheirus salmonis]|uniref:(salmon louse) hypothetical protein n=1 Tax=Lepeophtheirus salmonis TaxID=72036 RepID=A0A7R8CBF3_LEPSM|nr:unnamed protein product [Lepeophtheirus salmonis]CAF2758654.1 unnamed protein product [Lepeophtheirus salmonis]